MLAYASLPYFIKMVDEWGKTKFSSWYNNHRAHRFLFFHPIFFKCDRVLLDVVKTKRFGFVCCFFLFRVCVRFVGIFECIISEYCGIACV